MKKIYVFFVFCYINFRVVRGNGTTGTSYDTSETGSLEPTLTIENDFHGHAFLSNCSLVPVISDIGDHIASLVSADYQLVKIHLNISGNLGPLNATLPGYIYSPLSWILATSTSGKAMLMLQEPFEAMSLQTLSHGVTRFHVSLTQRPEHCLRFASTEEAENSLRKLILNNFKSETTELNENTEVCNRHVKTHKTAASLVYECCKLTLRHKLECYELKESAWFRILHVSITIIQVVVIVYSPYLLPESLFKARSTFIPFIFDTEPDREVTLRIRKLHEMTQNIKNTFSKTKQHSSVHMTKFKETLKKLRPNTSHSLKVKKVVVSLRPSKILAEGHASVSVISFLTSFFVRCQVRNELSSLHDCCNQDMLALIPGRHRLQWHRCLRMIMMAVMFCIIAFPWFLRVFFYYSQELEYIELQSSAFSIRNLSVPYSGNLLTYLSPTHTGFIAIYVLLSIEALLYVCLPNSIKRRLKFTVRKCFRDMQQTRKLDVCGMVVKKILWPLERLGVVGCLLLPVWALTIPIVLIFLAVEVLPTVNLSLRLLINLIYYILKVLYPGIARKPKGAYITWLRGHLDSIIVIDDNETNKRSNKVIHAVALLFSFVSIWCVLLLTAICLSFYVGCAVYVLIGFILHPGDTMKYASLFLLILVYGHECFSGARSKYSSYCKVLHKEIIGLVGDEINKVAEKTTEQQENTAFRIPPYLKQQKEERMELVAGSEGYLKWRAHRLLMFLDKSDIPYIPKALLFDLAKLPHTSCPGPVYLLYLKGLIDFMKILIFLFFVFVVVFAFGQASDISSGGQTIAALGSGFLPLVFRKFLFSTHSILTIEKNLNWQGLFTQATQNYAQRWNFDDIHVSADRPMSCADLASENATEALEGDIELLEESVAILQSDKNRGQYIDDNDVDMIVVAYTRRDGEEQYDFFVPRVLDVRQLDNSLQREESIV